MVDGGEHRREGGMERGFGFMAVGEGGRGRGRVVWLEEGREGGMEGGSS